MCGITLTVTRKPEGSLPGNIHAMTASLKHRGPDDEGYVLGDFRDGRCRAASGMDSVSSFKNNFPDIRAVQDQGYTLALGHRRLSIIDPSPAGHQPMRYEQGPLWTVFNGEIYNFREIRKDLEGHGYRFKSNSDTEVLLCAYHYYGEDMLQKLNGIFGFAIWDVKKGSFIAARDHFGVKPVYYYMDGDRFLLASEIKALLSIPSLSRELDFQSLDDFLTFRYTPAPNTLFSGIKRLAPGHVFTFDPNTWTLETRRFYAPRPLTEKARSIDEWRELYATKLVNAVKRQLISDVPLGILLSGGVDSGLVTAVAASVSGTKLKTFTVGFAGDYAANELKEARETANILGTDHEEIVISPGEYLGFMGEAVWYMDEPVGSTSLIPMYFVSKLAAQSVKVVLTGQGADEPMAGYQRYIGEKYAGLLGAMLGNRLAKSMIERYSRGEQLRRAVYALPVYDWKKRFVRIYALFNDDEKTKLVKPEFLPKMSRNIDYVSYWGDNLNLDSLNRMLYIDTRMSLADDLLNYGDKMSMAASIEARVPLLDVDLVNLIESMPSNLKLKGIKHGKYLHKQIARKWLPPEVIDRPKKGFQTPIDSWFQKELSGDLRKTLLLEGSFCSKYLTTDYISQIIYNHVSRKRDHQRQLFALFGLEMWGRRFFS